MYPNEILCLWVCVWGGGVEVTQDRDQWPAIVKTAMNFLIANKCG